MSLLNQSLLMLLSLLSRIPRRLVGVSSLLLAHIVRCGYRRGNQTALANIQRVYNLPQHSEFSRRFVIQVFQHQIASTIELMKVVFKRSEPIIRGREELRSLMEQSEQADKGCILITAHLGNWELLGKVCSEESKRSFYALAKGASRSNLQPLLEEVRKRLGGKILWADRKTIQRDMIRTLNSKDWLAFVMDQKPLGRKGPMVDLLGQATPFVSGPAIMAAKYQTPIIAAFCVREGPLQYRIQCWQVLPANHGLTDKQQITEQCATAITHAISWYPEQWCWDYKRWSAQGSMNEQVLTAN